MYLINNQNVGILLLFVVSDVVVKMAESFAANTVSRFRSPKTGEEDTKMLEGSIPKSTAYRNKWAVKMFHQWQINRRVQVPVLDAGGAFKVKDYGDLSKVQSLSTDLANLDANALNYWLSKFVQEVANSKRKVYPARTLYGIVCGIRRHLEETGGSEALNPLDASDKSRCLDAEMKDSTRQGVSLQPKKEEKEAVTDEDEEKFWSAGLFGSGTAKQLLDTIYFYNGKMFGLRGGEHRKTNCDVKIFVNEKNELAV
ncbi:zinc finger MYM-type protein 2-like [Montipora foliosa]|uniref:zinc finger MYM-type protein 2-like n=1 Tax=Montipora foliosa TaxID=591990 RepID=UPI0035F20856